MALRTWSGPEPAGSPSPCPAPANGSLPLRVAGRCWSKPSSAP